MHRDDATLISSLMSGDASLFVGTTAEHSLGWLRHHERYLTGWLDDIEQSLPRRFERTVLLGMGGSSSPARFYADSRSDSLLSVLDTSHPDTVSQVDFSTVNVIASSKSGTTIETQTLLAHALASGLEPENLVIITDPATSLHELGRALGAKVVVGDPLTGGRFSSLSPFGLVPALYAGWSSNELRDELTRCQLTPELIEGAIAEANRIAQDTIDGQGFFELGADPITNGGALWLEQLMAETTGKRGRGVIPVPAGDAVEISVSSMQHYHLVAALVARILDVDPFDQPDVDSAKSIVFKILQDGASWEANEYDHAEFFEALRDSRYNTLQAYVPIASSKGVSDLRQRVQTVYGTTTANLGPRYLHSTGQLHKGGPHGVVGVQIIQRPSTAPLRISGRRYSFHDLHIAQAHSDFRAMKAASRSVYQLIVDDLDEAAQLLNV
jgi:hypothetical protein